MTLSETVKRHHRGYLSAEAREYLGYPDTIAFYVDEEEQTLRIEPGDEGGFVINEKSGIVSVERAMRMLDIQEEGRVYLDEDGDNALKVEF